MRLRLVHSSLLFLSAWHFCSADLDGYLLPQEALDVDRALGAKAQRTLECPSDNVITTRYRCKVITPVKRWMECYGRTEKVTTTFLKVDSHWTDCNRQSCCRGYTLLVGRWVHVEKSICM